MKLDTLHSKILRCKMAALLGAGTMFAIAPGCDPEVSNTLVLGISQTLISALQVKFTRDPNEPSRSAGGAQVRLDVWRDATTQRA